MARLQAMVVVRHPFEIPFAGGSLAFDGLHIVDASKTFFPVHLYKSEVDIGNESCSIQFKSCIER